MTHSRRCLLYLSLICLASCCLAQQNKTTDSGASVTGHYAGTAKNKAEEAITVAFELTEKDGVLSGMIRSSHGDFPITGGSREGETVTIDFDVNGSAGNISLHRNGDQLVGTWGAGEDGGPVDVKKVVSGSDASKGKS